MRFKSQKTILEVLHYNAFINRIISSKIKASKTPHPQRVAGSYYAKIFSQILFKNPLFSSSEVQNEVQTFPPMMFAHVRMSFALFNCSGVSTATAASACSTCSNFGTLSRSAQ